MRDDVGLDELAAENLVKYVDDQREATGAVPDDRTIVVERFRDELGDWRVCILSPFGQRVHAPWGLAIEARLAERVGPGAQVLWSDDGIVIRLPEAEDRIPLDDLLFDPDEIEEEVVRVLPATALFASAFREASARALLLPRRRPGTADARSGSSGSGRPTCWSRPRSTRRSRCCSRPRASACATCSTCRRSARSWRDLRSRKTKLVAVDTERASPFAQSLLFRWVAIYMYEGDAPLAERRAAALALDRDLLRELLGEEELRDLLDPAALDELELELQGLAEGRRARNPDDVHDLLVSVGDLTETEIVGADRAGSRRRGSNRCSPRAARCPSAWRARQRLAAVEDAAALRDALGVSLPDGPPRRLHRADRPAAGDAGRSLRADPRVRSWPAQACRSAGRRRGSGARGARTRWRRPAASRTASSAPAASSASGATSTCSAGSVAVRSPRCARRSSRSTPSTLGRFLPAWQGVTPPASGPDALMDAIAHLQGAAIPASILEHDVLPLACPRLPPGRSGRAVRERRPGVDGRRSARRRRRPRLAVHPGPGAAARAAAAGGPAGGRAARRDPRRTSPDRGASFWPDLVQAAGTADERVVLAALWDLVWAGEVTNDTLAPLRALTAKRARATATSRARGRDPERSAGPDRPRAPDAGRSSLR